MRASDTHMVRDEETERGSPDAMMRDTVAVRNGSAQNPAVDHAQVLTASSHDGDVSLKSIDNHSALLARMELFQRSYKAVE